MSSGRALEGIWMGLPIARDSTWDQRVAVALPLLRRFAAAYLPVDDREDVIQDTLARAWEKRSTFDEARSQFATWACAILLDRIRKGWRKPRIAIVRHDMRTLVGSAVLGNPDGSMSLDVRRAVDRLPRRQREVTILFYYVDLSIASIAELLQCSIGTVKSSLHDARARLTYELSGYEH